MAPKNIKSNAKNASQISKKNPDAYVEEHCVYKGGKKEICDLIVFEDQYAKKDWNVQYNIHKGKKQDMDIKQKKTSTPNKKNPNSGSASPSHNMKTQENYFNCPCANNVEGRQTGHPLTSHETKKFNNSVKSRSDYDQYWLKVYNTYTDNMNYNLA